MTITEWANDDRLLQDVGGGLSSRMAKRWMDDLGFGWEQMPNFKVHVEADEEHSDMFLEDLEKFATGEKEALVYQAAKESMELLIMFRAGLRRDGATEPLSRRIELNANDWGAAFGQLARETMTSTELERYFSIPINKRRAQIILQQLSLYVRHRRDCWAFVSGNSPVLAIKQKILGHEYEEMIRDQHSEHGHLDLIIRQGKSIGLVRRRHPQRQADSQHDGDAVRLGLDLQEKALARRAGRRCR